MMMTIGRRRSSVLVVSLLISLNFILPTLFRVTAPSLVSDAPDYLYTARIMSKATTTNDTTQSATVSISHVDDRAKNNRITAPLVTTKTTVPSATTSKPFDDELTWNIAVNAGDSFPELPVLVACGWYGSYGGRHKRLQKKENATRIVATTGREGIPEHMALPPSGKVRLVVDIPCQALVKSHACGIGNWVLQTYLLRLAAIHTERSYMDDPSATRFSNVQMRCADMNMENRDNLHKTLVLPWLMGNFSGLDDLEELHNYWNSNSSNAARVNMTAAPPTRCTRWHQQWLEAPILYMLPFIRQDLRRLAVKLVGPPPDNPDHPAHDYLQTMLRQQQLHPGELKNSTLHTSRFQPLLTNVELDDVAIHFRCGDIMGASEDGAKHFHFIKFRSISDRILPVAETIRSIGIVTQPFPRQLKNDTQARMRDYKRAFCAMLCADVTRDFQQYLKERSLSARVSIRNGPEESIALAYARLIMAQHAFAAPDSTFSLFPVLATFGKGYHIEGSANAGMNRGVTAMRNVVDDDPRVVFVNPGVKLPALLTDQLRLANRTMAREEILKWFRVDDYNITFNTTE